MANVRLRAGHPFPRVLRRHQRLASSRLRQRFARQRIAAIELFDRTCNAIGDVIDITERAPGLRKIVSIRIGRPLARDLFKFPQCRFAHPCRRRVIARKPQQLREVDVKPSRRATMERIGLYHAIVNRRSLAVARDGLVRMS